MTDIDLTGAEEQPTPQPTPRQRDILEFIAAAIRETGYPPSVREIGKAVGLTSPSTVHAHLSNLQRKGFLVRDPDKPRAIQVRYDPDTGAVADKATVCHVPLIGQVAAGTDVLAQSRVEELMPLPADLTGEGELFMLRVRGESMIDAGIFDGDFVVVRVQQSAELGEIIVAGIPGDEGTVKRLMAVDEHQVVLKPENPTMAPMVFHPRDVTIFGRVVTVLRKL